MRFACDYCHTLTSGDAEAAPSACAAAPYVEHAELERLVQDLDQLGEDSHYLDVSNLAMTIANRRCLFHPLDWQGLAPGTRTFRPTHAPARRTSLRAKLAGGRGPEP